MVRRGLLVTGQHDHVQPRTLHARNGVLGRGAQLVTKFQPPQHALALADQHDAGTGLSTGDQTAPKVLFQGTSFGVHQVDVAHRDRARFGFTADALAGPHGDARDLGHGAVEV